MLLRYLILLLLFLNLGAAGWWLFAPAPAPPAATTADAQVPGLRLLDAAASAPRAAAPHRGAGVASAAVKPAASKGQQPAALPPSTTTAAPNKTVAPVCLRFGPFDDASARSRAGLALRALGVDGQPHATGGKKARAWNVSLPPLPSLDAAQAMAEKIKATGFNDLFVMREGDAANSIALGRFGSEAAARRRQAALREKGFAAQVAPVGATPEQLWLDATLPAGTDEAKLAKVARMRRSKCPDVR